jgi:hypothetical protein
MTIKNGDLKAMLNNIDAQILTCLCGLISTSSHHNPRDTITKREQFAMATMQSILSCDSSEFTNVAAISAVSHADALLAQLERTK